MYALLKARAVEGARLIPDGTLPTAGLSFYWDDAVRLLVMFPCSDTAARIAVSCVEG